MPKAHALTGPARHVLANLSRVIDKPYAINVRAPHRRSQLDGIECTSQITSLIVGGFIREGEDGAFVVTFEGQAELAHIKRS